MTEKYPYAFSTPTDVLLNLTRELKRKGIKFYVYLGERGRRYDYYVKPSMRDKADKIWEKQMRRKYRRKPRRD